MASPLKRFITVVLLVLALLFIAASSAFIYTSDPSFCARCHEIAPAYEGWRHSPHRNVSCYQCHADPGLGGKLRARLRGMRMLYLHFSDSDKKFGDSDKKPLPTCEFDWHRCYECHYNPLPGATAMPPLPPSHLYFSAEQRRQCAICHDDVSHGSR